MAWQREFIHHRELIEEYLVIKEIKQVMKMGIFVLMSRHLRQVFHIGLIFKGAEH